MPRWSESKRQWVDGEAVVLASAARVASGATAWLSCEGFAELVLDLVATAKAGTAPTLDLTVETADDAAGAHGRVVATFAQITGATGLPSDEEKVAAGLLDFFRIVWTIGGSAGQSVTFRAAGYLK